MHTESWERPLTALVERSYARPPVALESIAHYTFEDRVICRVRFASGPPGLLRAHTGDVGTWFRNQALALEFLERSGFPAPRVIRTAGGELLAEHDGWTGLMLTFVEGAEADSAPATLEAIGAYAAALHSLPSPPGMDARLAPGPDLLAKLPGLEALAGTVPEAARPFHRSAVRILRRLASGDVPPPAMLHGDCWPANAVRAPAGPIVMVDWEGAGRGPAVFELGYLLLGSHIGLPQLPAILPRPERVAAVVRGYTSGRPLGAVERAWLPDAVRYDAVQRAVHSDAFARGDDAWRQDVWLRKLMARDAVSDEIAEIAFRCLTS